MRSLTYSTRCVVSLLQQEQTSFDACIYAIDIFSHLYVWILGLRNAASQLIFLSECLRHEKVLSFIHNQLFKAFRWIKDAASSGNHRHSL